MSLGGILSVARTAINATQTSIQVASQNIANASTVGYSREQVDEVASPPEVLPFGSVGSGVTVQNISRVRDSLLDTQYRNAAGSASSSSTTSDALSQIDSVFGEPSTTGLTSTLDSFFNGWSQLASDPTSTAAKSVVQEQGQQVSDMLNSFARQLDQLTSTTRSAITSNVSQVNQLLGQIGQYNVQIVAAQAGSKSPANDLLDARDKALDQLSGLVNTQTIPRSDGTVAVYIGGNNMVDGGDAKTLTTNGGIPATVTMTGSPDSIRNLGGTIGAQLDVLNTQIPGVMSQLDSLAKGLVTSVNAIHSTGSVFSAGSPPTSSPAGNFFNVTVPPPSGGDPSLTARGISLDPTVAASATAISASSGTATGPGNNDVAEGIAELQTSVTNFTASDGTTSLGSMSFTDFYQGIVGTVAANAQSAQDSSTINSTLQTHADTQRQSVSGVSTDEELVNIIQQQAAYTAAARLVNIVDQMTQTLVGLGSGN